MGLPIVSVTTTLFECANRGFNQGWHSMVVDWRPAWSM